MSNYRIIRTIAKGGMGEVILAFDPFFQREIAIKKIRTDLKNNTLFKERFLKEAKITAQLTHPGVITIYSLHQENDELYYSMPYIEGKTLKEIVRSTPQPAIGYLLPIFQSICQTVAYAHSKKIIHRDLKPENILVGNFGEMIILDWGLAQHVTESKAEDIEEEIAEEEGLTHKGKIVGTIAYMAPERAVGAPASFQTDIYALGVILYLMLTLRLPFQRTLVKELRKNYHLEVLIEPEVMAPYRDVPPRLAAIVKKCLEVDVTRRYQHVEELLEDLSSHMEGRIKWFESKRLNINRNRDWELKENILVAKHIAIIPSFESADWVSLMISKAAFAENTRIETKITMDEGSSGIGILLSVPETEEREHPLDGLCLWLSSDKEKGSQLFRNRSLVLHIPDLYLTKKKRHKIVVEKIENKIHLTIDEHHSFTYLSYLPFLGTHVGLVYQDLHFAIDDIIVSIGSPPLQLSCLAIADAFLSSKDYSRALAEYRRIGYSFPGQAEGREALFRAGITLIENGKNTRSTKKAKEFYSLALEEFEKLHNTPGAPLEYLGKSLVYQTMEDVKEEIKALELALRRYHKHPLVHVIEEHILYRMQESAQKDRKAAYKLILIALRHIPYVYESDEAIRLFKHLIHHWETLYFIEYRVDPHTIGSEENATDRKSNELSFATALSFWLASPLVLAEIFRDVEHEIDQNNILHALCELGTTPLALSLVKEPSPIMAPLYLCHEKGIDEATQLFLSLKLKDFGLREMATLEFLLQCAIFKAKRADLVEVLLTSIAKIPLSKEDQIKIDSYRLYSLLWNDKIKEAEKIFEKYSLELLNQETTQLHPLYGCFLCVTEGEEIAKTYLSGVIDVPFPRTYALLGHQISNNILENPLWFNTSFMWERRQLYRQLSLYYYCAGNSELEIHFLKKEEEEYIKDFNTTNN